MAAGVSWQAEQAEAIGDFTSVVSCAWHGAAGLQGDTVAEQGCELVQTQVAPASQTVVTVPIFCENVTAGLAALTLKGAVTVMLQGVSFVQMQGEATVQVVAPCVPLIPSGRL